MNVAIVRVLVSRSYCISFPLFNIEDGSRLAQVQPGKLAGTNYCRFFTTRLCHAPNHETLSYTWGSPVTKN